MIDFLQKTWAIAWKNLVVLSKDRGELAVLFLMPLLFGTIMSTGFAGSGEDDEASIKLDVFLVNEDGGAYGRLIESILADMPVLDILKVESAAEADRRVGEGERLAAIVIPAGVSESADAYNPSSVDVILDPLQENYGSHVTGLVNYAVAPAAVQGEVHHAIDALLEQSGVLDELDPAMQMAVEAQAVGAIMTQIQEMSENPLITVQNVRPQEQEEKEREISVFSFVIPGFTVMFSFFLMGTVGQSIHAERDTGTFRRLLSAPLDRASIVAGTMIGYMIIVFLQVLVLFGVAAGLFGMPLGNSPVALVMITFALSTTATSLGILLGAVTPTGKQAGSVGLVLGFVLAGLGGTIINFRTYEMGGAFRIVAMLSPHSHAFEAFERVLVDGSGVGAVWPMALILLGFTVVFFAVAMWRLKWD